MVKHTLDLTLRDIDVFDTLDAVRAEEAANALNGAVYSWKTVGRHNWLEKGYKKVDTLALVVLPGVLPDCIEMAEDEVEEGVDC